MYKQILVAIDSSATSERALGEAIALAQHMKARLRLVHVVDTSSSRDDEVFDKPQLIERGEAVLARARDRAADAGIESESGLLETGPRRVAVALGEDAEKWHADLVVMGTHARTGFSYLLSGSVAEEFIRLAKAPLLLTRMEPA